MPYETGTSGNPAGRPKGRANKATTTAREAIAAALAGVDAGKLAAHLDSLSGKDYIDAYVKLAEFITPKLQRTALAADGDNGRVEQVQICVVNGRLDAAGKFIEAPRLAGSERAVSK